MSDNLEPGRTDMFVPGPHDNAEPHEGVRESAPRVARSISNQPQSESEPRANKTRASLRSPRRSTPRARRMNLSSGSLNKDSPYATTCKSAAAGPAAGLIPRSASTSACAGRAGTAGRSPNRTEQRPPAPG